MESNAAVLLKNWQKVSISTIKALLRVSLHTFTLPFRGERYQLEKQFRHTSFKNDIQHLRVCHLLSIVFFVVWGYIDALYFPDTFITLFSLKFFTIVPMFTVGYLFTFTDRYEQYHQLINGIYVVSVGGYFIVTMDPYSAGSFHLLAYTLTITYIFNYTFIRSRVAVATAAGWILYAGVVLYISLRGVDVLSQQAKCMLFYLLLVNVLGMIISYTIEVKNRKEFLLQLELTNERDNQQVLIERLSETIETIQTTQSILPICSYCKKVRDNKGDWQQVEKYFTEHSDIVFTHGVCDECMAKVCPEIAEISTRKPFE